MLTLDYEITKDVIYIAYLFLQINLYTVLSQFLYSMSTYIHTTALKK